MTDAHLTPEEIEFLRNGEAAVNVDHLPRSPADALSHIPHSLPEQDRGLAERAFGDDQLHGLRVIHDQFARQAAQALQWL